MIDMGNNSQITGQEIIQFPEKIIVSCVTKNKGPLTKIMKIDPATKALIKDGSECSMGAGKISQIKISSPAGFAKMLRTREHNQAIVHGICLDHENAKIVSKKYLQSAPKNGVPVIARTKDYIVYPDLPGVMLFDHDKARDKSVGSDQALKSYSSADLVSLLSSIHPDIESAAYVSTPSTSSCIFDSTGALLRGEGTGSHIYLFAKEASDIPRYLETMGKRLFLAGLGRIEISRSGSLLTRTLIDLLVGSPERLDFVAGAVCQDGLCQKLPEPSVKNGGLLDTKLLPNLTEEEEKRYLEIIKELSRSAKPAQECVISEYIEKEAAKLVSEQTSIDEAKKIVISRQNHILEDEDILFFAHTEAGLSVASVLANGDNFHDKSLADPLEPDYEGGSKTKAKFFWNDGNPIVHSYAHGSTKYKFRQFEKENGSEVKSGSYPQDSLDLLTKMNKEYAAVLLGGDFRIAMEGFDDIEKKNTLSFLKLTSLYSYFQNTRVAVYSGPEKEIEYKEIAKVWMGWEGRRTYNDVVFDPSMRNRPGTYNLFKGFPLAPRQGDWSLMRDHIREVICDGNTEHFAYVMAWMARAVQDPGGDKPGVAIVMKGGKGIGKGVFANYFGAIFGEAFLPIADSEGFTGKFNMHLSKSLVVFLDEAVWGGDKKAEGKLKQLITEPTVLFEPKGIDSIALRNFINVLIASNEDWIVPATGDERRFCVLLPSNKYQKNTAYFKKIVDEQKNGGAEAMMYDLLRHDYHAVDLRKAPITEGLIEQVQESLPNVLEFWHSVITRGYALSNKETGRPEKTEMAEEGIVNQFWPTWIFKFEVFGEYNHWCKQRNERYPRNNDQFWKETWKIWAGGKPARVLKQGKNGDRFSSVALPVIKEMKESFTANTTIRFADIDEGDGAENNFTPYADQF